MCALCYAHNCWNHFLSDGFSPSDQILMSDCLPIKTVGRVYRFAENLFIFVYYNLLMPIKLHTYSQYNDGAWEVATYDILMRNAVGESVSQR